MNKLLTPTTGLVAIVLAWMIGVPAHAYEAGPVTGGGKIDGKVVFNDAVPTRKIIPNKDVEVCGGIREEPLVEVGPDKGVQNAVVYLVEVAKGKPWPAETKKPAELDNLKCRFVPDVQVIRAGPLVVGPGAPSPRTLGPRTQRHQRLQHALVTESEVEPLDQLRHGCIRGGLPPGDDRSDGAGLALHRLSGRGDSGIARARVPRSSQ